MTNGIVCLSTKPFVKRSLFRYARAYSRRASIIIICVSFGGVSPPTVSLMHAHRGMHRHMCVRAHTRAVHWLLRFCVVPGLTWFFAGVQLWRLCLPARVHSRFCRGNSLSSKRERNLRWISIGSRRAPPIAKRPCSIATATGYRQLCTAPLHSLNFDPANLAYWQLTTSIGPFSATWFFIVAPDHSRLFLLSMKWFINNISAFLLRNYISALQWVLKYNSISLVINST